MEVLKIEVIGRWGLIAEGGDATQGKLTERAMTPKLLDKYLTSGHSPIRRVQVAVTVKAASEPISHLVRHVHAIHFVESAREDITGVKRDDRERLYIIQANLQEWIHISHDRLCNKAADSTKELVFLIKDNFLCYPDLNLQFLSLHMKPSCEYSGFCKEVFKPCGMYPVKELNV